MGRIALRRAPSAACAGMYRYQTTTERWLELPTAASMKWISLSQTLTCSPLTPFHAMPLTLRCVWVCRAVRGREPDADIPAPSSSRSRCPSWNRHGKCLSGRATLLSHPLEPDSPLRARSCADHRVRLLRYVRNFRMSLKLQCASSRFSPSTNRRCCSVLANSDSGRQHFRDQLTSIRYW